MVKLGRWRFSTCASAEGDHTRLVNAVNIDVATGGEREELVLYVLILSLPLSLL